MFMSILIASAVTLAQAAPQQTDAGESKTCFPDCSPGYLCHEGTCIEACNPKCGPNQRCNAERICVDRSSPSESTPAAAPSAPAAPAVVPAVAPAVAPASTGMVCVIRRSRFSGSALVMEMAVDGALMALLPDGQYACRNVPTGTHRITVSTPVAGIFWQSPAMTLEGKIEEGQTISFDASFGGNWLTPTIVLMPLDDVTASSFKALLPESVR